MLLGFLENWGPDLKVRIHKRGLIADTQCCEVVAASSPRPGHDSSRKSGRLLWYTLSAPAASQDFVIAIIMFTVVPIAGRFCMQDYGISNL